MKALISEGQDKLQTKPPPEPCAIHSTFESWVGKNKPAKETEGRARGEEERQRKRITRTQQGKFFKKDGVSDSIEESLQMK